MNRCVLFDFDGTLNDTWRLYLESFRRSLEPHFNRLLSDTEIAAYQPSAERRLLRTLVEEPNFTRYFESFLAHYMSLHETHNDGPYPCVHEPAQAQEAFRAAAPLGVTEYFTRPSMVAARLAARHQEGFQCGATRD